jgi:hypothetical protein
MVLKALAIVLTKIEVYLRRSAIPRIVAIKFGVEIIPV